MLDDLCEKVHQLIMNGKTQTEACRLVARGVNDTKKLEGHNSSLWGNTKHNIRRPNQNTLMGIYRDWRNTRMRIHKQIDHTETVLQTERTLQTALKLREHIQMGKSVVKVDDLTRRVLNEVIKQLTLAVYSPSKSELRPFVP